MVIIVPKFSQLGRSVETGF